MPMHQANERSLAMGMDDVGAQVFDDLVEHIAKRYCNMTGRWDLFDDFKSEGLKAILEALDKKGIDSSGLEQSKGLACVIVRAGVVEYLHKQRWSGMTGISRENYVQAREVQRVHDALLSKTGHMPTVEEIAQELGLSHGQVDKALMVMAMSHASFVQFSEFDPDGGDGQGELSDHAAPAEDIPSEAMQKEQEKQAVIRALGQIPVVRRKVIELRIYEERSFREIGDILGKSPEAVRQDWQRGIQDLKKLLTPEGEFE